tara:strand:+ start:408 stop:1334 length:927 start_codon:yes stop_codon:yes gene_type:complete
MSNDNIQADTPKENPQEFASLEEAVFGGNQDSAKITDAFTTGDTGNTETASAPAEQPVENVQKPANNDETRFQYWQSEADKAKNELKQVKQAYEQLASQAQAQAPVQQEAVQEEMGVESFPDAPMKPQRPSHFSREEALADPSSESARYMDSVESWRDDMNEYNSLKSQYQATVLQEKIDSMERQKVEEAQRFQAQQAYNQKTNEVKNYIQGHHGLSEQEANDFVNTMSKPDSINIDNLVQLYRMNSGKAAPQPAQPSETFTQLQNAQQVPSPMGVMPSGQTNADSRTMEDKIMDTMIGNFNSKNPWK